MSTWVEEELKTAEFKDQRTTARMAKILLRFYESPDKSIKATGRDWDESKAAYRFFGNEDVTPEKMLRPHADATLKFRGCQADRRMVCGVSYQ